MDNKYYRQFDQLRTTELNVIRHGWFSASFELTDGQFSYGTISFTSLRRRQGTVETADGSWVFDKPFFSRVVNIRTSGGELIGTVSQEYFYRLNHLTLNNGFTADFTRTGFFPTEFTWANDRYGEILRVRQNWFNFTNPLKVTLNPTVKISEIPLLAFLGTQMMLLRQRRKAAAH